MKKKVLALLLVIAISLGVFAPGIALAAEGKTNVTIHKLITDKTPNKIDHNGEKLDLKSTDLKDKLGVSKIEENTEAKFGYVDVSGIIAEGATKQEIESGTFTENDGTYTVTITYNTDQTFTKKIDAKNIIKAGTPTDIADGQYAFFEVVKPENYTGSVAVPFLLELPLTNDEGKIDPLHIYPKNTVDDTDLDKDVTKEGNKEDTAQVGEDRTWILKSKVPANIKDYKKFRIVDPLSEKLTFTGNVQVKVGDTVLVNGKDYDLYFGDYEAKELPEGTIDDNYKEEGLPDKVRTLVINFKNFEMLQDHQQEKIRVTFTTFINENAIMGEEIENGGSIEIRNPNDEESEKEVPDKPKVWTGGKKFKKIDEATSAEENPTTIEGAIFELKDEDTQENVTWNASLIQANLEGIKTGKFAYSTGEENQPVYSATNEGIIAQLEGENIYLRSGSDGTFEIKGLGGAYENSAEGIKITHSGNYSIKEVQAPEGYAIPTNPVTNFTVTKTSYYKDPTQIELEEADPEVIENRKYTIPQTGGTGTIVLTAVGLTIMAVAFIALRKNKNYEG